MERRDVLMGGLGLLGLITAEAETLAQEGPVVRPVLELLLSTSRDADPFRPLRDGLGIATVSTAVLWQHPGSQHGWCELAQYVKVRCGRSDGLAIWQRRLPAVCRATTGAKITWSIDELSRVEPGAADMPYYQEHLAKLPRVES